MNEQRKQRSSAWFFSLGPSGVDLSPSNPRLRAQGMAEFLNPDGSYGGGGYGRRGRLLFGGFGEGGGAQAADPRWEQRYGYGSGHNLLGFTIIRLFGLSITPVVGFGGAGIGAQSTDTCAQIVEAQRGSGRGPLAFAGLLVEFHLPLFAGWGPMAGVLLGYRATFLIGKNDAAFDLPDDKRDGVSGFFWRSIFGIAKVSSAPHA